MERREEEGLMREMIHALTTSGSQHHMTRSHILKLSVHVANRKDDSTLESMYKLQFHDWALKQIDSEETLEEDVLTKVLELVTLVLKSKDSVVEHVRVVACCNRLSMLLGSGRDHLLGSGRDHLLTLQCLLFIAAAVYRRPTLWPSIPNSHSLIPTALLLFQINELRKDKHYVDTVLNCLVVFESFLERHSTIALKPYPLKITFSIIFECYRFLIDSSDKQIQIQALGFIQLALETSKRDKVFERELYEQLCSGYMTCVVPFLVYEKEKFVLCESAVSVIGSLFMWNEWKEEVVKTGFLTFLAALLSCEEPDLVRLVLWALSNYCCVQDDTPPACARMLLHSLTTQASFLPALFYHLNSPHFDCHMEALWTLLSLVKIVELIDCKHDLMDKSFVEHCVKCFKKMEAVDSEHHDYLKDYHIMLDIFDDLLNSDEKSVSKKWLIDCDFVSTVKTQLDNLSCLETNVTFEKREKIGYVLETLRKYMRDF